MDNPSLGSFVDVVRFGGQPVELCDDGEVALEIGICPGNFVFQRGLVVVGLNGGAAFGQYRRTDLAPDNQPIPSLQAFGGAQAALVFWDDIDDKDGDVHYLLLEGHPSLSDRLIVQWDYHNFDGAGSTLSFQVHVLENQRPTGIYAQYAYHIEGPAIGAGDSATIGYQDGVAGFGHIQLSYDSRNAVKDGTVLSLLIPEPADLDGDGTVGILDLFAMFVAWGPCPDCQDCPADLDGDCAVGAGDLFILISSWS